MSHYPEKGLRIRFVDALRLAEIFLFEFNKQSGTDVRVDPAKLYLVFKSAMDDIQRYKDYHFGKKTAKLADAVKRAAFVTKWLLRFRPLWEPLQDFHQDVAVAAERPALTVNEEFAISLSLLYLSDHVKENMRLETVVLEELLYNFLYRDHSDDSFMLYYKVLADTKSGRSIFC